MHVYLLWVRRFARHCKTCDRDPWRQLTLQRVALFARRYARARGIDEKLAFASARPSLRAWSFALRELGHSPPAWQQASARRQPRPLLREYCEYQRRHRGVATSSVRYDVPYLEEFLSALRAAHRRTSRIRIADVDAFMAGLQPRLSRRTISRVCCSLRSFLRFLHATGRLPHDLSTSVAAPVVRWNERPPRALPWRDVQRIISAIDLETRTGLRNRAVLLLMATYGMGAAEVTSLQLGDVDWRAETLQVTRPKTGACVVLPLLPEVAQVLADYLRRGRPRHAASRALFLGARVPHGPLSSSAIRHAVRQYAEAAGVTAPMLGSHVFRHSHATRQIDHGAPLKIVGDILGHRDPASTSVYVAVATKRLRRLALPVPR